MSSKYLVAGLLPLAACAHAENTPSPVNDTMVVTASRFEQPVENVIAPVSVVTRADIKQSQAKTLTEVLRRLPGVEVTVNGGIGQQASLFIRGTNSNHALVLLDGVRMNNSITSGTNINRIPLNQIERVELIRGSGAAMYGSDAIGGVLNIITRSTRGTEGKSVTVGAGSNEYREGNFVASSDVSENGHLKIAAGFQQTDGFNVTPKPGLNDGDKHGFDGNQLMVNYEHVITERWTGFASLRWFDNTAQYNHWSNSVSSSQSESTSYTGKVEYKGDNYRSFFVANYQDDISEDTLKGGTSPHTRIGLEQTNLQWANHYNIGERVVVQAGLDWRSEKLNDDALGYNATLAGERRDNSGAYAGVTSSFGDLTLLSNIRFDKHDTYDEYTTWSVGSIYQLDGNHQIKASYGTSFKAPNYTAFAKDPTLKPEEARNIELGFIASYQPVTFELALYDNEIDNLNIYYSDLERTVNVDARIRGAELQTMFSTGIVNHTVVAEYKDPVDSEGAQLARRSKENFKWIGDVSYDNFDVSLAYVYTGDRPDLPTVDGSGTTLDAYGLWDLGVSYWVSDALAFRGRIDNLFDEKYETTGGYPAPERAYYLSLDYNF